MSNKCKDCEFHDWDYEWDEVDEEEYPVRICKEGHNEYVDSRRECPFFQEFVKEPYVEKYTKCDKCELLQECISTGNVVETTMDIDGRRHFVIGLGVMCKEKYGVKGV